MLFDFITSNWWILLIIVILFLGLKTINQGTIGVVTMFGKYHRILRPGLNLLIPFIEQIFKKVSVFKTVRLNWNSRPLPLTRPMCILKACCCMLCKTTAKKPLKKLLLNLLLNGSDAGAFKNYRRNYQVFCATKRQAEILALRREIVEYVKEQIDVLLEEWGYHLLDLQINDITFDQAIIESV